MSHLRVFLLLLMYSLKCQAQVAIPSRQLGIGIGNGQFTGYNVQWFGSRFELTHIPYVRILDTGFYQKQHIRKIEVLSPNRDSIVWWSVTFDPVSGAVREEGQRTGNYFITMSRAKDSLQHTDTTIEAWYRGSRLMRLDTVVITQFHYRQGDTDMSFERIRSVSYYTGLQIDERNDYYNNTFLHKQVAGTLIGTAVTRSKKAARHVYLHRKLRTDYDSTILYLDHSSQQDEVFRAIAGPDAHYIPMEQLGKHHPFFSQYHPQASIHCYTSGACFDEPRFYYETNICGTMITKREREARETAYGFTSDDNGLFRAFYSERVRWTEKDGKIYPEHSDREILYVLRYSYF